MASNVPETLKIAPNGCDEDESSYFDVMMIGRTGFGKSTVGNKLLGIDSENKSLLGVNQMGEDITTVIKQWDIESDKKPFFETGEGRESVTKKCKLLSNEKSNNRVLDTRGFADTENTRKYGVIKGNLQSFRWILQAQRAYDLRFSRVLYFFPNRGPPERSDGTLQEEIKVMHGFFGQQIFDVMVIIVTNNKRDHYQQAGFSEEDIAETKEVFQLAFKEIIEPGTQLIGCPPVIYIPFDEDHKMISDAVVGAGVISDREKLYFSPEFPKVRNFDENDQPLLRLETPRDEMRQGFREYRGKCFRFEDRCTRCAIKIVNEKLPSGEEIPVYVVYENGDKDDYDLSYCHPLFVPKYSRLVKIVGGIAHIVVFGMGKVYEKLLKKKSWPGFSNCEEVCVSCRNPPRSESCKPVNQYTVIRGKKHKVDHSKELDTMRLLQEGDEEEGKEDEEGKEGREDNEEDDKEK